MDLFFSAVTSVTSPFSFLAISYLPDPPIFIKTSGGNDTVPSSSTINSLVPSKSSTSRFAPCSATNLPSRNSKLRSQNAATSSLCVTIRNATPLSLCNLPNSSRTSRLVIGSKAPVGSSANINFGLVTKALAIATLCCSPPESVAGILLILSSKPSSTKISIAFLFASDGLTSL